MTDNGSLADLKEMLASAEQAEAGARVLRDEKHNFSECAYEFGDPHCEGCGESEGCESLLSAAQKESEALFEEAWQAYHAVERLLREHLNEADSIDEIELLARVLMDIHIHPNSGLVFDSPALWEAQYLWLHLYYRTKEGRYFEKARFCDGIRHATVTQLSDAVEV
jgi:hypothetical protein